jgi:hypothetical protein
MIINLDIPEEHTTEIIEAFAYLNDYEAENQQNPISKTAFAKKQVINYIKQTVKTVRAKAIEEQRQTDFNELEQQIQQINIS